MPSALQEKRRRAKRYLAKKVLPRAHYKGSSGLVAEFARLWQNYEAAKPGAFRALNDFVDTVKLGLEEMEKLRRQEAGQDAEVLLLAMNNEGYGKAIRARNVLNKLDGSNTHWHDGGNGAAPPEERIGIYPPQ